MPFFQVSRVRLGAATPLNPRSLCTPSHPSGRPFHLVFTPFQIVYAGLPDAEGRVHILRAAKARMEGPRTKAAASSASAQLSAADGGNRHRDEVSPATLPEEPAKTVTAAAATSGAATPPPAPPPPLEDTGRDTKPLHPDDTSSIDGGGGDGDGSGRTGGGGGGGGGKWARDVDIAWLSQQTKGYSGADLSSLVRNAALVALREERERAAEGAVRPASTAGGRGGLLVLARRHFETALASTEPSSGPEAVAKHERWARQWHVAS